MLLKVSQLGFMSQEKLQSMEKVWDNDGFQALIDQN
jgi:hypothetical protein